MQHEGPIKPEGPSEIIQPSSRYSFQCSTGHEGIRTLLERVTATMEGDAFSSENLLLNTQIVLGEVLNNIEEHGYAGESGGQIKLWLEVHNTYLAAEITDFGKSMPGLELPPKRLPDANVVREELPEGGFGWFLIHTLAPNPVYTRRGNTNILNLVIPRDDG